MKLVMKFFNKNIVASVLAVVLLLSAVSCGSQKKNVESGSRVPVRSVSLLTAADMSVELRKVVDSYGAWNRVRVPVTVALASPKNISISGTAIMERDKSVMISLKYFGFEIGSLYVEGDSITIVDKVHKSYVSENVRRFLSGFDLSVSNVQDLLFGRLFIVGRNNADFSSLKRCDMEIIDSDGWLLIPEAPSKTATYGFRFSPADVLSALICQTGENPPVTCTYLSAVATTAGTMSSAVTLDYKKGKSAIEASLEWNFKKARWNDDVELRRLSIGKDYKRLTSAEIAKLIQKL